MSCRVTSQPSGCLPGRAACLAGDDLPALVELRREVLGGEVEVGLRRTRDHPDVERVVRDHEEGAAGRDGIGERGVDGQPGLGRQVQERQVHQVVRRGRWLPRQHVALRPAEPVGDLRPRVARVTCRAVERDLRDVDAVDLPAASGQPERIAALAAPDVERPASGQVAGLGHHDRVRVAAPQRRRRAVALVPERRGPALHRLGDPVVVVVAVVAHLSFSSTSVNRATGLFSPHCSAIASSISGSAGERGRVRSGEPRSMSRATATTVGATFR